MKRARKKLVSTPARLNHFRKRWNIAADDESSWLEFKERFLNSFSDLISLHFHAGDDHAREYFRLVGIHPSAPKAKPAFDDWSLTPGQGSCPVYQLLVQTADMKKFTLLVQGLFWTSSLNASLKRALLTRLKEDIACSGVPIEVIVSNGEVLLYPAGAKLLDERLVNDVLHWLEQLPAAHDRFAQALQLMGKPSAARDVVDNLRLALELTIRYVLGNSKSLENQHTPLKDFLKFKGLGTEVTTLYWTMVKHYTDFQNDRAKHGNKVKDEEVEFILYLTGTFIRFLIPLAPEKR